MIALVTGAAGFIGYHLSMRLLEQGYSVIGIDNLNDYYDVGLKQDRLAQPIAHDHFTFQLIDLSDRHKLSQLFKAYQFDYVVNLAAQAGVRYSIENPYAYLDSNIVGFLNLLEGCRSQAKTLKHLIFASSSSVYGTNQKIPFATTDIADSPVSLYAASKKSNELMAHSYSHLYNFPVTGLRFFTVYGPWGRPDMAYFKFLKAIQAGETIDVYNYGKMQRDFTYIDDIIEGMMRLIKMPVGDRALPNQSPHNQANYKIYNIGNNQPVSLADFITAIETATGKTAHKNYLPMQPGDVPLTYADISELARDTGFQPSTPLKVGMQQFVDWYSSYYITNRSAQPLLSV